MIGRDRELGIAAASLERARAGEPGVLIVEGEVGIGKSRLIAELRASPAAEGVLVLFGGCPPVAGRDLPLAPLLAAIRGLIRDTNPADLAALEPARPVLAPLLPAIATGGTPQPGALAAGAPPSLGLVFEHVLALLERLAEARPAVMLVLEDLHWAAPSTWDLVAYLGRNLVRSRVLVVCSYRDDALLADPRDALVLAELTRTPGVTNLPLRRLETADASALAAAMEPSLPRAAIDAVVARADGNPYLLGELVAAPEGELPDGIRAAVEARLAALPEQIATVLRAASLIGRRFDGELLIDVLREPAEATIAALRLAVRAGILEAAAGADKNASFSFRQEITREVIEDGIVPEERSRLHGRIARALASRIEGADATPERVIELAAHWRASDSSIRAVPALLRAARAAEGLRAYVEAHRLYAQAFEIARQTQLDPAPRAIGFRPAAEASSERWDAGPEWAALYAQAAETASLAGDAARAIELAEAALAHPARTDNDVATWTRRRARYLLEAGRGEDAIAAFEGLERVTGTTASDDRARILLGHAQALASVGRHREAAEVGGQALAIARTRAPALEWQALNVVGAARAIAGEPEAGLALIADARARAERGTMASVIGPRPSRVGEVLGAQADAARALAAIGATGDALGIAQATAQAAERLGAVRWQGELQLAAAAQQVRTGAWDAAAQTLDGVLGAEPPAPPVLRTIAHILRGRLLALRGEFAAADADLALAAGSDAHGGPELEATLRHAEAELAALRRRNNDAVTAAEAGLVALAGTDHRPIRADLCLAALRASVELALDAAARRATAEAQERRAAAERWLAETTALAGASDPAGVLALARAEHARLDGGDPEAWTAALDAPAVRADPYLTAVGRWRLAEAMLAKRDARSLAGDQLRAAHRAAVDLRAEPLRAEIESLASRARIDLVEAAAAPAEAPSAAAQLGLSERELEVLALVAQGRTNRQIADELFITEKTAGHHVSNILGKLGVANRLEAAAIAHRAGLIGA
jgi:DNA-binding CsgD family transcriptional regulator